MATIAKIANGTLLKMGDAASPEVFTTVPEVRRLSGPTTRLDLVDVTSHDSPTFFREYLAGLQDGDFVNAEINWRPANSIHKNARIASYAATLKNFKIVFPDSSDNTVAFAAYIMEIGPTADIGEQLKATVRLKITGVPTWS